MTTPKNYIFYKIYCHDNDYIYVGSTCNFNNRKRQHKENTNLDNKKKEF
jgi:predicted GIY-YIG superfamily endonuclease